MSFKDEINKIKEEYQPDYYTDEEVYEFLIKKLYKDYIKNPIREHFKKNPTSKTYTNKIDMNELREEVRIDDEKEMLNYRYDSKLYTKVKTEEEYDSPAQSYIELCGINKCYNFERKGKFGNNKRLSLTPLGERVLKSLKTMAANDGIEIEVETEYLCGIHHDLFSGSYGGSYKKYEYHPKLGEWFSGKDPKTKLGSQDYGGGSVFINIKFEME